MALYNSTVVRNLNTGRREVPCVKVGHLAIARANLYSDMASGRKKYILLHHKTGNAVGRFSDYDKLSDAIAFAEKVGHWPVWTKFMHGKDFTYRIKGLKKKDHGPYMKRLSTLLGKAAKP